MKMPNNVSAKFMFDCKVLLDNNVKVNEIAKILDKPYKYTKAVCDNLEG